MMEPLPEGIESEEMQGWQANRKLSEPILLLRLNAATRPFSSSIRVATNPPLNFRFSNACDRLQRRSDSIHGDGRRVSFIDSTTATA
ncbi:unnamed protein product [Cuscuta campestris]|uniref:Uncharacterized protein n=1 Tax=Cuscuta campestris TaxID=132261 RepID=A0A484MI18_9ASTE|nr:unnamed protein product [Cuscuta campestris]